MPLISNVIGRKKFITDADHGTFLLLSDTGQDLAGMWCLQFVPDPGFNGSLSVQARIQGQQAYEDAVGLAPVPYRAAILNGVIDDYSLKSALITGSSLFYVPASGLAVALGVSIVAGSGVLYSYARQGDAGLP